jgi:hypothetical protein
MPNDEGKVKMNGKWPAIARSSAPENGRSPIRFSHSAIGNRKSAFLSGLPSHA